MKLLFISDNFPPEVNAPARRTFEHCKEWIKNKTDDIEITVITCFPNYPKGKVYKGYKNKLYQKENIEGIRVIRVWSYMTANEGFLKRILDYMSFAFMAYCLGLFQKTDIIIATSPQFFTAISAYLLSISRKKPWVFEVRDLWPDSIKAVNAIKKKRLLQMIEKLELFLYRKSNKIIVVTQAFKKNLIRRNIKKEKIEIVTNGVDLDFFWAQKKDENLLAKYNLKNKFIVAYIGTHGMSQGLTFIIESIADIEKNEDIIFLFIGNGADKKKMISKAKALKLSNVLFFDSISKEYIASYINLADVALIPLKKNDVFKEVIPSKIFEAAAMRKPILLGVEGEAQKIIQKYKAGICFEPENRDDFLKKLLHLYMDKDLYKNCQKACENLAKNYDRKQLANKMLNYLKKTID